MPTRQNVHSPIGVTTSIAAVVTATTNGASRDTRLDRHGSRYMAIVSIGTLADAGYTPVVEDSADDSSFAALTPLSGSFVEVTTSNDPLTQEVSFVPVTGRPFVRVTLTETTAGTSGGPACALIVQVPSNV